MVQTKQPPVFLERFMAYCASRCAPLLRTWWRKDNARSHAIFSRPEALVPQHPTVIVGSAAAQMRYCA
jgi:hypothetical protein